MTLKIDLHVHTHYSTDSSITPEELFFHTKKKGLDGVAITDHGRIDGALKIAKQTDFLVIPGIEVECLNGHVLGLDLQDTIPQRLTVAEAVEKIHTAGGIAVACHPTSLFVGKLRDYANSKLDAVEVINSAAFLFNRSIRSSQRIATELGTASVGGSDAHYAPEIGCAYTLVDAELEVDSITRAISQGLCQPFGRAIPLTMRLRRKFQNYSRLLRR